MELERLMGLMRLPDYEASKHAERIRLSTAQRRAINRFVCMAPPRRREKKIKAFRWKFGVPNSFLR